MLSIKKATPIQVNLKSKATNTKPIMPALAKGKRDIKKGENNYLNLYGNLGNKLRKVVIEGMACQLPSSLMAAYALNYNLP